MRTTRSRPWRAIVASSVVTAAALAVVLPATAAGPMTITSPKIPGAAALFGPVVDAGAAADTVSTLKTAPDVAVPGKKVTVTGAGLAKAKDVRLVWMTANVRWILDPKADSVDYIGRKVDKIAVALANTQTDATGAFKASFRVPKDFGGLHDIFAVVDGKQVAKGGFLLERTVKISPTRGPVGTPITVTVVGMGSPTYESVGAVLYDNHYAGAISANTTRGVSIFKIRASGGVGAHWIELAGSSHTVPYLNMQQSPVPWTDGHRMRFQITADKGAPKPSVESPAAVQATIAERTTLQNANLAAGSAAGSAAQLDERTDPVEDDHQRHRADRRPAVRRAVGQRRRQPGQLHRAVLELRQSGPRQRRRRRGRHGKDEHHRARRPRRLARRPDRPGRPGEGPDELLRQADVRLVPKRVKAGQPFVVELKGVGWTQLDNTVAVTYDNSYIGYACGFNSNGYVRIQLFATGTKGTHLIDLYPLLYTQQPAYPYPQLGMVPLLGYAMDAPGLGAGYDLPAIRLAITVV